MIPEDVIDQVSAAADIVAILSEYVKLKKVGSVYRGPCPFHQGTGPNFSVVPRGGYHCSCVTRRVPSSRSCRSGSA